jgi:tetratricopeptide (TPR) repeat protein
VALSPRKQTIIFQLGSFYITSKQYDKAASAFKTAYDLDHSFTDAAQYYAVALIYVGHEADARAILSAAGLDTSMTSDAFLRSFIDTGNWTRAIAILRSRIAANPSDMSSLQNLAAAYYQAGNKPAAIATIKQMETVDPTFKAQGEQFIQQIQAAK